MPSYKLSLNPSNMSRYSIRKNEVAVTIGAAPDNTVTVLNRGAKFVELGFNFEFSTRTIIVQHCSDKVTDTMIVEAISAILEDGMESLDEIRHIYAHAFSWFDIRDAYVRAQCGRISKVCVGKAATANGAFDRRFDAGTEDRYHDLSKLGADNPQIYIRLWHGRKHPDEELQDWGFEGPIIPIAGMHVVYGTVMLNLGESGAFPEGAWREIKHDDEFVDLPTEESGLVVFNGLYYGDWCLMCGPRYNYDRLVAALQDPQPAAL